MALKMHPQTLEKIKEVIGVTIMWGLAGGLFYQSCLRKTTLEDVTVTSQWDSTSVDHQTDYRYDSYYIRIDKYDGCLETNGNLGKGNKLKSITYQNRLLRCPKVIKYE